MTEITAQHLIEMLHIPINQVSIDGDFVYLNLGSKNVGTCLMKRGSIIETSLNWKSIYELNKKKLVELIHSMYEFNDDKLEIIPKPERVLELKFKGTEMSLPGVQYAYHSNGEWTLKRAGF